MGMAFRFDKFGSAGKELRRWADVNGHVPEQGDLARDFTWDNDGPEDWQDFVDDAKAATKRVRDAIRPKLPDHVLAGVRHCWQHLNEERDRGTSAEWWGGLGPERRREASRAIDWMEDWITFADLHGGDE